MIITLKGADFSASNIGTLSTWRITRSLGSGATYNGPSSVDKDAAFSATVTLAEDYEIGTAGVSVIMGGTVLSGVATVNGNTITINIDKVTGNVTIKVPTVNTSTGGDEPVVPDVPIGDGDGTEANPWAIRTASDLVTLGAEVDAGDNKAGKFYALANDIDLTGIDWNPIGADSSNKSGGTVVGFSGTLDGRGHVIRNISINSDTIQYAGLFGGYFDGTLMNLGMEGGSITTTAASSTVGALARKLVSTTNSSASVGKIVNCYSRVPCTAVTRSSGLIDAVEDGGIVAGCYQAAAIKDGSGFAIKAESVNSGTIDYCLWNKDLTTNGIASNSSTHSMGLTTAEFATAASTLNANMNEVAELAGIDVTKLVIWKDGEDGYPVLVPGSYGTADSSGEEEPTVPTAYTLTISKGTGVENVTVTKTSGYGATGALNSGATIYKGDVLTVSATASSGYTLDSYTPSITVNSNVTVNVTATAETPAPDDVTTFAGGAGTETDPYLISNAAEFKLLHDTVDSGTDTSGKHYALTNDIDLSVYSTWDPIGAKDKTSTDKDTGFKGTLDGRGHIISGVNVTGVQYAGLFGTNMAGTIMNLGIEDSTFSSSGVSKGTTGSLCRKITAASGKIVNCYSLANVAGQNRAGGLVDDVIGGLVAGCYYAGTATNDTANNNFALTSGSDSTGTLAYCLWDSDLSYANGYSTAAKNLTVESCEGKAEITADDMNGNLNAVATLAGIDVAKLCTWEDREGSYPRLVVKSA